MNKEKLFMCLPAFHNKYIIFASFCSVNFCPLRKMLFHDTENIFNCLNQKCLCSSLFILIFAFYGGTNNNKKKTAHNAKEEN